jgi:dTDP-4-amino-4,6-dideoxygalactose transaminase
MAGTFGHASTFSFYPTKNLGGLGDGGAVAFKSSEHALRARLLAQYGWTERYQVSLERGFNSRIDEVQAAVLMTRASKINTLNVRRREIAMNYASALSSSMRIIMRNDESYTGHLVVLEAQNRKDVIEAFRSHQIETAIHYPVLDQNQLGWRHHFNGATTPNADELSTRIVSLPCFPLLSIDEINRVIAVLQSF